MTKYHSGTSYTHVCTCILLVKTFMYIDFFVILGSHLVLKAIKAMIADDCDEVSNTRKPLSLGKMGHIIKI